MEIEVRAKIKDIAAMKATLEAEAEFLGSSEEDDLYLRHENDIRQTVIFRIRRKESGAVFTVKGKSSGDDTAWPDVDLPLVHPDDLEDLLLQGGYIQVVRIEKRRLTFQARNFEINLDIINDLGNFIEIEGRGSNEERYSVEQAISRFLVYLGITESDIIRKGYVPLMLEKIAPNND
jgi:adenylate cyclase class 2